MISGPVRRALAAHNGGPGLTEAELIEATGLARSDVRQALADMIFIERMVTCDVTATRDPKSGQFSYTDARFRFGDPTANVLNVGAS